MKTAAVPARASTANGFSRAWMRRRFPSAVLVSVAALIACATSPSLANSSLVASSSKPTPALNVDTAQVLAAVRAAQHVERVPKPLYSRLANPDLAGPQVYFDCIGVDNPSGATLFGNCAYGDPNGKKLMVIYGDSHSAMWAAALEDVAIRTGWKLKVFEFGGCPAPDLKFYSYQTNAPFTACTLYHKTAVAAIRALHPKLVLVTSISDQEIGKNVYPSSAQWQDGLTETLRSLSQPGQEMAVIGDIPEWPNNDATCLAAHLDDAQACSVPESVGRAANNKAEKAAAARVGALYVDTEPWICGARCEPIIHNILVYYNNYHITYTYAQYLSGALQESLAPLLRKS